MNVYDIEDVDDNVFLDNIGRKLGSGFQGDVYDFISGTAVKTWRNNDKIADIKNEINNTIIAGETGCGPEIFDFRKIDNTYYMVMEKIIPVKLVQDDYNEIIKLFKKLIKNGIVNYDGSFGRTEDGKLILFDYGVSEIVDDPKEARKKYCTEDYFWTFNDIRGVDGLLEYFCGEKSPSPGSKSPSPKKRRSKKRRSRKRISRKRII